MSGSGTLRSLAKSSNVFAFPAVRTQRFSHQSDAKRSSPFSLPLATGRSQSLLERRRRATELHDLRDKTPLKVGVSGMLCFEPASGQNLLKRARDVVDLLVVFFDC